MVVEPNTAVPTEDVEKFTFFFNMEKEHTAQFNNICSTLWVTTFMPDTDYLHRTAIIYQVNKHHNGFSFVLVACTDTDAAALTFMASLLTHTFLCCMALIAV